MTNDELAAHVERLRKLIDGWCWDLFDIDNEEALSDLQEASEILKQTPTQSLAHIKAQAEEETIERCAKELKDYGVAAYIEEYIINMPRKYAKDGE